MWGPSPRAIWQIRKLENGLADAGKTPLKGIPHHKDNKPLKASMSIEDLLQTSTEQNFAPVVDDRGMFIGIITRKRVITYLCQQLDLQAGPKQDKKHA